MAAYAVTGDQYRRIDRRMREIKRQLDQLECPLDPEAVLDALRCIVEGNFDAVPRPAERRLIDCDAAPFVPDGWSVVEHKEGGQIAFDASKALFHLDDAQKTGTVTGDDLHQRLANMPVLNANVLDFLLANTSLIPESWKLDERGRTRYLYFWGTLYRNSDGHLCVRVLCWDVGRWRWSYDRLDVRRGD